MIVLFDYTTQANILSKVYIKINSAFTPLVMSKPSIAIIGAGPSGCAVLNSYRRNT